MYLTKHIREIGNSAFCCSSSNSQLEKVYLNDNVEIIGDNAFRGNPKLSNLNSATL